MRHLTDAVAIVTGASSGIGAATARRLAADGARVVLAARDADDLRALADGIRAAGGQAAGRVTDVTNADDLTALVAFAEETFGPVDILVNNAGLMLFSYWREVKLADWDRMIDVNLRGYLHAIAAVMPGMIERGSGRILNMSSVAGHHVGEAAGVYGATKFFIRAITESLRQELGTANGIQVGTVSPGVIDTGWSDKLPDGPAKDSA